jgi:hypothetical protein
MQLEFIVDDIRDHTLLDAEVYKLLQSDRNTPLPPAFILAAVAASAPDNLDPKFQYVSTARDIVQKYSLDPEENENENLEKLLRLCWRHGKFRKIRCLSEHSFTNLLFLGIHNLIFLVCLKTYMFRLSNLHIINSRTS